MPEAVFLNPNEPNPNFMVYKEDARKIILKVLGGKSDCFWILGKTGIGKTTFLLWLNEYAPLYRVEPIYFHGGEELKFEEFREKLEEKIKPSVFSRIFMKKKAIEKPVMLLIDEIGYIKDERILKHIVSKLDDQNLHLALVMASVDEVEEVKNYLKGRDIEKIYLEMPPEDVMLEMIKKRIEAGGGENFQPFGKQLVKDVIESSDTIREVLIKLREAL